MSSKVSRKPFRIGASHAVTLPRAWCQYYGDRIRMLTILESGVLIIAPEGLEAQAQELVEMMEKLHQISNGRKLKCA
jgi:hypothetical protein